MEVHQALGVERRRVEIVGIARRKGLHRGGVFGRELRFVGGRGIRGVPLRERLHVGALVLRSRGRQRQRLLDLRARLLQPIRLRLRVVVVRAEREGHAPARHGRGGIERGRLLERPVGLLVVEAEEKHHPLIEELLRLGVRGVDGMSMRAHAGVELDRLRRGRRSWGSLGGDERGGASGEGQRGEGTPRRSWSRAERGPSFEKGEKEAAHQVLLKRRNSTRARETRRPNLLRARRFPSGSRAAVSPQPARVVFVTLFCPAR